MECFLFQVDCSYFKKMCKTTARTSLVYTIIHHLWYIQLSFFFSLFLYTHTHTPLVMKRKKWDKERDYLQFHRDRSNTSAYRPHHRNLVYLSKQVHNLWTIGESDRHWYYCALYIISFFFYQFLICQSI